MASTPGDRERLTAAQRADLEAREAEQDRTLGAMHVLEAALSRGAFGRAEWWQQEVLAALGALDEVMADEAARSAQPDSLLSQVAFSQPRLRNRVRGLRTEYARLRNSISALREDLDGVDDEKDAGPDVADVRQRLAWLLTALRHYRARESDLIYEAYYDTFERELDDD
jgi:ATP phosphoribosyltransferase regulatory subunit HisZ